MLNTILLEYIISIIIAFILYFVNINLLIKLEEISNNRKLKKHIDLHIKKIHIIFIILSITILVVIYVLFGLSFKVIMDKIIYINTYIYIILLFVFSVIKSVITTGMLETIFFRKYSNNIPFLLNNKYINLKIANLSLIKDIIKFGFKINLSLNIIFFTFFIYLNL